MLLQVQWIRLYIPVSVVEHTLHLICIYALEYPTPFQLSIVIFQIWAEGPRPLQFLVLHMQLHRGECSLLSLSSRALPGAASR